MSVTSKNFKRNVRKSAEISLTSCLYSNRSKNRIRHSEIHMSSKIKKSFPKYNKSTN